MCDLAHIPFSDRAKSVTTKKTRKGAMEIAPSGYGLPPSQTLDLNQFLTIMIERRFRGSQDPPRYPRKRLGRDTPITAQQSINKLSLLTAYLAPPIFSNAQRRLKTSYRRGGGTTLSLKDKQRPTMTMLFLAPPFFGSAVLQKLDRRDEMIANGSYKY
jgi:hypothetical protein